MTIGNPNTTPDQPDFKVIIKFFFKKINLYKVFIRM